MDILAFAEVCKCATVSSYIIEVAKGFTKDIAEQKDLYYTAWLKIVDEPGDYTVEAYCETAYKAMSRKYQLYYMPVPNINADGYSRKGLDYGVVKSKRIVRRYFKKK